MTMQFSNQATRQFIVILSLIPIQLLHRFFNEAKKESRFENVLVHFMELLLSLSLFCVFVLYYLVHYNNVSQKLNVLITFMLFTFKENGQPFWLYTYAVIVTFMYGINLLCGCMPSCESWIYRTFGYETVRFLVGNSPGHLAGRAVATGVGYIALKRLDEFTSLNLVKMKVDHHLETLSKSGEILNKDTLERVYQEAQATYTPSILTRAENLASDIGSNIIKHAVTVIKETIEDAKKK
jgi:hypothetical protein